VSGNVEKQPTDSHERVMKGVRTMLKAGAFANSLAILTGLFYLGG
jgi:hypothetical protein